ncbi:hypothetical protein PRIPAC_93501 [Pristionchus pacificus]|uniref:Uncharacterized protein n=1 Tax=Pristionchus pacificus TaxID=54126 RepID=A0A2A6CHS0_PRIPA|nr:hypothetical protein PRIPAC_93501 [Pristionchus pacificus]|eukprot:PDM77679.1 hypothetical protein PRIPAC_34546 [Pristionchus pacificus]
MFGLSVSKLVSLAQKVAEKKNTPDHQQVEQESMRHAIAVVNFASTIHGFHMVAVVPGCSLLSECNNCDAIATGAFMSRMYYKSRNSLLPVVTLSLSHSLNQKRGNGIAMMGDTRPVAQADGRGFSKLEMEESGGESRPPVVSARMENLFLLSNENVSRSEVAMSHIQRFKMGLELSSSYFSLYKDDGS